AVRRATPCPDWGGADAPRGRVAHPKAPPLPFLQSLDPPRRLVDRGLEPLELAQRLPLRLADGLAGRLDRDQRRGPPFFFLTRRGAAGLGFGAAARAGAGVLPSVFVGAGDVREVRFGPKSDGIGVFGISRRVIRPCPTVHKLVVTQ